ncbi:MAG: VgrG-related protein [Actinomycetota bacterium]|nr:VgrG-related protein [Actinomycetota bacterium]
MPVGTSQCQVLVMEAPLDPLVASSLGHVEVDSTMYVPSQAKLVFHAPPDSVLLPGGLQLATPISVAGSDDGLPKPLMTGEITSVEVEHEHGDTLTIVRAMDRSHRLMRGTKTMAYPEMTASDVVLVLLGAAGVLPGEMVPTTNIYSWLTQANVSSWVFIQQLAALENYVAYSDALGLFNFTPMPTPSETDPPALSSVEPLLGTQLAMGVNLVRLRVIVNGAEQVPEVTVTGYDPAESIPVIGPAPTLPSTSMSIDPATLPPLVAGEFEADPFFDASRPFDTEGAAMHWAESIAADIAGALAEVEGECIGNPSVLAGEAVTIGLAGQPFDGYYICSAARHVFEWEGASYTTWFTAGGYKDRSLLALSSGSGPVDGTRPSIPGLVIGTVVDNMDPDGLGQVKVMFPWLAPDYISAWARVMQIGASKLGGGFLWVPEVGDEVLIGFDRGSIDHPFVIGNLYNGIAKPLPAPAVEGVVGNRRIASRMAHTIQWNDGPEKMGISIMTAPVEAPPTSVVLDGDEVKITINSLGEIEITGTATVKISSEGQLTLDAPTISIGSEDTANLSIAAGTISIGSPSTASVSMGSPEAEVSVTGSMVSLGLG